MPIMLIRGDCVNEHASFGGGKETSDHTKQGCFADSRLADDGDRSRFWDHEINVSEDGIRSESYGDLLKNDFHVGIVCRSLSDSLTVSDRRRMRPATPEDFSVATRAIPTKSRRNNRMKIRGDPIRRASRNPINQTPDEMTVSG